jgi:hypothetical protein
MYITDDYLPTHNSEPRQKTARVVEIDPATILDKDGKPVDVRNTKALRKWLIAKYSGAEVTITDDGTIQVYQRQGLESGMKRREPGHRDAYADLSSLMENAVFDHFEPVDEQEKHQHMEGQRVYYAAARIDGKLYSVKFKLDVPKIGDKTHYKDHKLTEIDIAPALSIGRASDGGYLSDAGAISNVSLEVLRGDVKASREENGVLFSVATPTQSSGPWSVKRPRNAVEEVFDKIRYQFEDKHIDLKKVIKAITEAGGVVRDHFNTYISETLMHGRVADAVKRFHDNELKPILNDLEKYGIKMERMQKYLHARHARERNDEMAKLHPTREELDLRIADLDQQINTLGNIIKTFGKGNAKAINDRKNELDKLTRERDALKNTKPWTGTLEDRNRLSGMSNDEADQILQDIQNGPNALIYLNIGRRIDQIVVGTRAYMQAYGLETADTVETISVAYKHYVPLKRDMEESDLLSGGNGSGNGLGARGSNLKRATGSLRDVENIFANLIAQRESVISRGEKNRVAQSLYGLVSENPNAKFWALIRPGMGADGIRNELLSLGQDQSDVNDIVNSITEPVIDPITGVARTRMKRSIANMPNVIPVRINGEDRLIVLSRKDDTAVRLAQAMRNEDQAWFPSGAALGAVGNVTRYLAAINTQYNPIFGFTNLTRDIQDALLNLTNTELAGKQKEVMKGIKPAMKAIWATARGNNPSGPWAKWYQEFLQSGAATGYKDSYADIEDRARAIEREAYGIGVKDIRSAKDAAFVFRNAKGVKQVLDFLSDYNTAIENATRLSAYVAARNSGLTAYRAADIAKGLTVNFNRKGASSGAMSNLYAFFNAAVQGTSRMMQTLNSPAGKKIIYGGISLGVFQAIIGSLVMGGDDWDDIQEFEKSKNLILPFPNGDKNYIKIPMPLGFNMLPNIGRSIAEMVIYHDKPAERSANLLLAVTDSFNPLGSGSALAMVMPSFLDPAVELKSNKDAFGKQIERENISGLDPTPGHTRARESTSSFWVAISKAINYATGGNEDKPGMASPTPEAISYLFGVAFGGLGREVDKGAGFIGNWLSDTETPPYRIPGISRFYGEAGGEAALRGKYYNAIKDINIAENQMKGAWNRGEEADDDIINVGSLAKSSRALQKTVSDLQKARNTAQTAEEERKEFDLSILEARSVLPR